MTHSVLITGAAGGIGTALCQAFHEDGWHVIATSRKIPPAGTACDAFIKADLDDIATDETALATFKDQVMAAAGATPLKAVVNNAALQYLGKTEDIDAGAMQKSFNVNVVAPFLLTQAFLPHLEAEQGSVLNIGTVHAQATKPEFVAYATTKTAMHGLTRALAVDLGGRVRVNTLAPAATATPMLMAGFEGRDAAFRELSEMHPARRIAEPGEIGDAALFLCSDKAGFITGSTFYIDGGILARLHDPV